MSREALVVGINRYQWDGLQNLSTPAEDAEAIALWWFWFEYQVSELFGTA